MRSKYIYLIYYRDAHLDDRRLVSAHTVKHEAHTWLLRSGLSPDATELVRVRDGLCEHESGKEQASIPWDAELLKVCGRDIPAGERGWLHHHCAKAASEVSDWPDWAKGHLKNDYAAHEREDPQGDYR